MGRGVVVRHAEYSFRPEALDAPCPESVKSLWAGDLVTIEAVYVELGRAILDKRNDMRVPDFVK